MTLECRPSDLKSQACLSVGFSPSMFAILGHMVALAPSLDSLPFRRYAVRTPATSLLSGDLGAIGTSYLMKVSL